MAYVSAFIVPTIIFIIVMVGVLEKKDVFNLFCEGADDGIKTMFRMFPTLVGIFLAIGMLRKSGLLDFISNNLKFIFDIFNVPNEILPLILIKPISGSATLAMATDLMNKFGVDSKIGNLAGTIMSSSETTFYVWAVYLGAVKIKKSGNVLIPSLIADLVCIIVALLFFGV